MKPPSYIHGEHNAATRAAAETSLAKPTVAQRESMRPSLITSS